MLIDDKEPEMPSASVFLTNSELAINADTAKGANFRMSSAKKGLRESILPRGVLLAEYINRSGVGREE